MLYNLGQFMSTDAKALKILDIFRHAKTARSEQNHSLVISLSIKKPPHLQKYRQGAELTKHQTQSSPVQSKKVTIALGRTL
jgi:hypothetical protein